MIDLHYSATPNGQKIAIMLEEIREPYRVIPYDIFEGDQLTAEFGRINPNHKLPAIVDHAPAGGGDPVTVFESGAILQYLAEKSGRFLPALGAARAATLSWLTWQVAGLGPMGGQASHFLRYAPAGQDYATERYTKELTRLLTVLEKRLEKSAYVAGDDYSIADMAIWPGRASAFVMGMGLDDWPAMRRWFEEIRERPAVARAMTREELKAPAKYIGRHQALDEKEWSNMFGAANHAAVKGD
ncbi:glutathione binding-like protein [Sphingopyxis sp. SE2]|jgi:GST-like protein|uniref:glutathione binding-like protein n=1 Tax=unclassified Sphingopyxis TaxID=2614943 RepID=UPI00050E4A32|nr:MULTISPECIES: glutathione binding-like protein [unclassified Sphingopyxis]KGB58669.1 Glutathione S-transferase-like protein [Sphingopyxis sp. LC363]MDT7528656.1 glutathione binding-like protein [Sphingopyxis sp. SE2]